MTQYSIPRCEMRNQNNARPSVPADAPARPDTSAQRGADFEAFLRSELMGMAALVRPAPHPAWLLDDLKRGRPMSTKQLGRIWAMLATHPQMPRERALQCAANVAGFLVSQAETAPVELSAALQAETAAQGAADTAQLAAVMSPGDRVALDRMADQTAANVAAGQVLLASIHAHRRVLQRQHLQPAFVGRHPRS